jgi:acetyl esterase/lipase
MTLRCRCRTAAFAAALHEKGVPFELHVFPHGSHGLGLANEDPIVGQWQALCVNWLKGLSF